MLDRDFFNVAARFADAHSAIDVIEHARFSCWRNAGAVDAHPRPLAVRERYGDSVVDLRDEPSVFLGVSSGGLFRLDRIRDLGLRFDPHIRPNFEDAQFAVRFLLDLPAPGVGLLRDRVCTSTEARGNSATLQSSMSHPGRYADVLELGYLDIIERGRRPDGSVPAWIQQLIVYELSWYLSGDERISTTVRVPPELAPRFHELLDRILRELDPAVVARHRSRELEPVWVDLLAHAGRDTDWHSPAVVRSRDDRAMRLRRFNYRYVGRPPRETFRAGGETIKPAFQKTMAHRYFDRDFLWERILWLPDVADLEISPRRRADGPVPGGTAADATA